MAFEYFVSFFPFQEPYEVLRNLYSKNTDVKLSRKLNEKGWGFS